MPAIVLNGGTAGAKASVSAAATVSATLETTLNVRSVQWSVAGTDETSLISSFPITQTGSIGQNGSLTAGAAGTAGIIKATCAMKDGTYEITTAKWYVPTTLNSAEVIAYAEDQESGSFGWAEPINEGIRLAAAGASGGSAGGDLSGTYPNPTVARVNGTTVPTTAGGDAGKALTVSSAGVAAWTAISGAPSGAAGGDLSGTYPNPTAAKINGTTVPTTAGGDAAKVLTCTGANAATWQTPSGAPSGSAGGDLGSTYPNPTVVAVNGITIPTTVTTTGSTVQTTDGTQTTLATIALADSTTTKLDVIVVGKNTGSANGAVFNVSASYVRHSAGAPTILGAVTSADSKSTAGAAAWAATIDTSSNDARVRVTGAAATTINWVAIVQATKAT